MNSDRLKIDRVKGAGRSAVVQVSLITALLAQGSAPVERSGDVFRLVFHAADLPEDVAASLADAASARLEAFSEHVRKFCGVRGRSASTIHLYRDLGEYGKAANEVRARRFPGSGYVDDGVGHVVLFPTLSPEVIRGLGRLGIDLPQTTRNALLRVAAEVQIAPAVPKADAGHWMLNALVMGAVDSAVNPKRELGVDFEFDLRRMAMTQMLADGHSLSIADLKRPSTGQREENDWIWRNHYAALVAAVCEDKSSRWARRFLRYKFKPPRGGHDLTQHFRHGALEAVLGRDMAKAELRLGKVLARPGPTWHASMPFAEQHGSKWILAGGGENGLAFVRSVAELPELDYFIAGRFELGAGVKNQVQVTFGYDGKTTMGVLVSAGGVRVSEFGHESGKWRRLAAGVAPIEDGEPFDLRIELDRRELRVLVGGDVVCTWRRTARAMHGLVSIGAQERIVIVEDLQFGKLGQ